MKLKNITQSEFIDIFGLEGLELIEGYDCDLLVIDNATTIAIGGNIAFSAFVAPIVYTGETEATRVLVVNYEAFLDGLPSHLRFSKAYVRKAARAQLVHERTHVKQMMDGRLIHDGGTTYWEGVEQVVTGTVTAEYFNSPWEKEAYLNQFMYEMNCGPEEAEKEIALVVAKCLAA